MELGSHWTDFHDILYLSIFRKSVKKIQVCLKSDKIKDTLHEDLWTFMIVSRPILIRMRNVSDKSCREKQNTCFMFSNVLSTIVTFMRKRGKIRYSLTDHR